MNESSKDDVRNAVREQYGEIARKPGSSCCQTGHCCSPGDASLKLGYSAEDIATAPEGANLGLGCGNPLAIAALAPGDTVLDLGSGGGFDCFLAAKRVGPNGRVIGVDMTPDMVTKARRNAEKLGATHVDFRLGEIEHLPVADASVQVVLSNCVINLSPDKAAVFREAYRVLVPGGRLAIADIVSTRPLPPELANDVAALTSCVSGAVSVDELKELLRGAGFADIRVDINEKSREVIAASLPGTSAENYVVSARIQATRPKCGCSTSSCCG